MGEWLRTNCIPNAESLFSTKFDAAASSYANLKLTGFMNYEYFFLRQYINGYCANQCASTKYLFVDGSCQDRCPANFTTDAQRTCYSPCAKNEFTKFDLTCSSTCASPNVPFTFVGGQKYCARPGTTSFHAISYGLENEAEVIYSNNLALTLGGFAVLLVFAAFLAKRYFSVKAKESMLETPMTVMSEERVI
jgi:hypothetical protein